MAHPQGLKQRYEEHTACFTSAALKQAVELSARYINDRKLPDNIDVIDEAAAAQNLLPPSRRRQ